MKRLKGEYWNNSQQKRPSFARRPFVMNLEKEDYFFLASIFSFNPANASLSPKVVLSLAALVAASTAAFTFLASSSLKVEVSFISLNNCLE
jgi:hypothetical protein